MLLQLKGEFQQPFRCFLFRDFVEQRCECVALNRIAE
ncbi:hypothetical protein X773_03285 [Mesorhizobium sp. LSJC285A00]|nr:hypothetical protein X773_03285 [Mesorhizobium sp. LSJC285A00]